jgi:hypothetical protein
MKQLRDPVGPLRADKQQLEHHGAVICDVRGSRHAVSLPAFLREMTGGLSAEKVLDNARADVRGRTGLAGGADRGGYPPALRAGST